MQDNSGNTRVALNGGVDVSILSLICLAAMLDNASVNDCQSYAAWQAKHSALDAFCIERNYGPEIYAALSETLN